PRHCGFPAKPMQRARREVRYFALLDNIEAAAVDHPNLRRRARGSNGFLFFSQTRVEPREVVSCANPHDARKDVCPTKQEVEPFVESGVECHQEKFFNFRDKWSSRTG